MKNRYVILISGFFVGIALAFLLKSLLPREARPPVGQLTQGVRLWKAAQRTADAPLQLLLIWHDDGNGQPLFLPVADAAPSAGKKAVMTLDVEP